MKLKTVEKINETKANKNKINKLLYGTKKKEKKEDTNCQHWEWKTLIDVKGTTSNSVPIDLTT